MGRKDDAAIRRKLHDVLQNPVEEANALYGALVHLRHGRLEYLTKLPDMIARAKYLTRSLKTLSEEVGSL